MKDDQGCVLVTSAPVSLVHQAPPGHCCPVGSDVLLSSVRGSGKVEGVLCLSVTTPAAGVSPEKAVLRTFTCYSTPTNVSGLNRASGRKSLRFLLLCVPGPQHMVGIQ